MRSPLPPLAAAVVCTCFLGFAFPAAASPDAEADWQAVVALEAGPRQPGEIRSREEARTLALSHLARQEAALREFLKGHPDSPRGVDARLRLARLYANRCDFSENPADFQMAIRVLQEGKTAAPVDRRADFDFTALTLSMRRMTTPTAQERDGLTAQALEFQNRYPNDRRVAPLIAEAATLSDHLPQRKGELLRLALSAARTPEVTARIQDDLRRLSFLGQPVEIKGATAGGTPVDLAAFHGKVTLVYFFASWSMPSLMGLEEVETLRKTFSPQELAIMGVSVDSSREALDVLAKERRITWPVIFDGLGWKSPLIRGLSINAVPTLWIVDRQGHLRTLNARGQGETQVRTWLK